MSTQEQRARFEAAQRPRTDLAKNRKGDYTNPVVQHCWRMWKDAEAATIERCIAICNAELYAEKAAEAIRALLPKEE